jgi:Cu2+-exporting ATPase
MSETQAEIGLFLDAIRCAGCVRRVEQSLAALDGVEQASVSFATERARVRYDPARQSVAGIVARVRELGYGATPYDPDALERPSAEGARRALVRLLVAGFLAANAMSLSLALYLGSYQDIEPGLRAALRWLVVGVSLPAVTWCAAPFWRGAWAGLRRRSLTMDVPVVLGSSTAFVASVVGTLGEAKHVFADSAATIVFLLLLGRTLERSARAKAAGAVERLLAALPSRARRRGAAGIEEVPPVELATGDRVLVAPGAAFPADGRVEEGATEVDESLVSGESRPRLRERGDEVTGGTRNLACEVEIEVTAPVARGSLARMAALLERSELARPSIQRAADRVAAVFAPAVLGAGLLAGAGWLLAGASALDAALVAAAVLIVACPCALGLATPVAVVTALGRGARLGILFKSGEALERCARVDRALLDKTGTVTEGRPRVWSVVAAPGVSDDELLGAAAAAEGGLAHPLAAALREAVRARGLRPAELAARRVLPGRGVVAGEGALRVAVGTLALLESEGIDVPAELVEAGAKVAARGATLAWVARGREALGFAALEDALRADAALAVSRLRGLGVEPSLVSGDHADAVALAAARTGISNWAADVTPEQKVARVEAERSRGGRPLVAGDGVNDAAALAAAEVGIAFARGADVSVHAAHVVVRAPRLGAVPDAIELSRAALRRIRQGLALAVGYNALAVPLAAAGWLEPLAAAVAMSCSSLLVTGNALRLARWRPRS